jgi:hypothetical protein
MNTTTGGKGTAYTRRFQVIKQAASGFSGGIGRIAGAGIIGILQSKHIRDFIMAERKRTRRNTLERRCLSKSFKRLFMGSSKTIFKMLEGVKPVKGKAAN